MYRMVSGNICLSTQSTTCICGSRVACTIELWCAGQSLNGDLRRPELVAVLKNGSVIFFYFCICNIHGIPSIHMCKKNIPHRDCSETGAISKYVSNVAFLYEIYSGKHYFSHSISILKKMNSWNFEKLINDIYIGIFFILVRK